MVTSDAQSFLIVAAIVIISVPFLVYWLKSFKYRKTWREFEIQLSIASASSAKSDCFDNWRPPDCRHFRVPRADFHHCNGGPDVCKKANTQSYIKTESSQQDSHRDGSSWRCFLATSRRLFSPSTADELWSTLGLHRDGGRSNSLVYRLFVSWKAPVFTTLSRIALTFRDRSHGSSFSQFGFQYPVVFVRDTSCHHRHNSTSQRFSTHHQNCKVRIEMQRGELIWRIVSLSSFVIAGAIVILLLIKMVD